MNSKSTTVLRNKRIDLFLGIGELFLLIALIFGCMALYLYATEQDWADEQIARTHYCHMVDVWESQKHLAPEQRMGWPDFKGNYHEACF